MASMKNMTPTKPGGEPLLIPIQGIIWMNELRCERSFMMKPIGRLALPAVAASPLEVVQIIGGFGIIRSLTGLWLEICFLPRYERARLP
jgi:hypothetical protein